MSVLAVGPGVDRVTSGIANWYLIEASGGITLVDAGCAGDWRLLVAALAAKGKSPDAVAAVVLTHAHSDHTGFAERARREAGTKVAVHEAEADQARGVKRLRTEVGLVRYLRYAEAWRTYWGLLSHGGAKVVPIVEASTFAESDVIDVPGRPRVIHVPGHTLGSSSLFFEDQSALFTGDALVTRNPLTGRIGPQVMSGALNLDSGLALESLNRLRTVSAEVVLPGHGEPWRDGINAAVEKATAAGRS